MSTDWGKHKVVDLRAELNRRKLSATGLKQELVDRLTADDASPSEATEEVAADSKPALADTTADEVVAAPAEEAQQVNSIADATTQGASNAATSQTPSVPPVEVAVDDKKRKRRSASPPPSNAEATPRKRLRENGDYEKNTPPTIPAGDNVKMEDASIGMTANASQDDVVDYSADSPVGQHGADPVSIKPDVDMDLDRPQASDAFYYDAPNARGENDSVEPALHPETDSLYIGNFMRPLKAEHVEDHLIELSTPPGSVRDRSVVSDIWVDSIRTHALVQFTSVAAATRVRNALHGKVWPNERNRKPLWVDFVPSNQVLDWISMEKSEGGGRRGDARRWEVVYRTEGGMTIATHQIAANDSKPMPPQAGSNGPNSSRAVPTGPANPHTGIESAPSGPRNMGGGRGGPGDGRGSSFTRTQPSLQWSSVSPELVRRRLENLNSYVSRDPNRDVGTDCHRYSYTRSLEFIDRGPETFVGIRPPHRERGPRPFSLGGGANSAAPSGSGGGVGGVEGGNGYGNNGRGPAGRPPLPPQSFEAPRGRRGPRGGGRNGGGGRRRNGGGGGGGGNRYGEGGRFGDGRPPRYEDFRYRPSDNDHRSDRR